MPSDRRDPNRRPDNGVDEASEGSFPASDPPSRTGITGPGSGPSHRRDEEARPKSNPNQRPPRHGDGASVGGRETPAGETQISVHHRRAQSFSDYDDQPETALPHRRAISTPSSATNSKAPDDGSGTGNSGVVKGTALSQDVGGLTQVTVATKLPSEPPVNSPVPSTFAVRPSSYVATPVQV